MFRKGAFVLVLLLSAALALWAKEFKMENRGPAPAARGTIHTDRDRNGNTAVEVKVEHIAPPQRLTPPSEHYLVWVKERGKDAVPLGELRVNTDKMAGSLKGTTPAKVFDVLVTAEDKSSPSGPSGPEILHGHVEES
jgi:hypothetical protein